jgi:hypothetical protein
MARRSALRGAAEIAADLAAVALTAPDAAGRRGVGKNSLAEQICGGLTRSGNKREGRVVWRDVQDREHCKLPTPASRKEKVEGQDRAVDAFDVQDVPLAVRKLLGARGLRGSAWTSTRRRRQSSSRSTTRSPGSGWTRTASIMSGSTG